jgi:hypothetical protein
MTDIRKLTLTRSLLLSLALGLLGINLIGRPAEASRDSWRKRIAAKLSELGAVKAVAALQTAAAAERYLGK